jgi:hypothetical protein
MPSTSQLAIEHDGEHSLCLVVRGQRVVPGDDLSDRFGFDIARLDERLLRILVTLAVRRHGGGPGWMTAEELGLLALNGASGSATAKLLEVSLRGSTRVGPQLIEFRPAGATGGGRSRGPYRLGVPAESTVLDEAACWCFLTGRVLAEGMADGCSLADHLAQARAAMHAGRFIEAQALTQMALRSMFEGVQELRRATERDRCYWLAQTCLLLSNVELEIGATRLGLLAVARAQRCFERIRHPEGSASALLVEANLRGQIDDTQERRRSYVAARNALVRLDDAGRGPRRGMQRAIYIGTLGQRMSLLGQTRQAARRLRMAHQLCEAASSRTWAAIWEVRLGQNALTAGDRPAAERFMASALEAAEAMTPSGYASLVRGMSELSLATGRLDEAERWIVCARTVGEKLGMGHQVLLADRLMARLERL